MIATWLSTLLAMAAIGDGPTEDGVNRAIARGVEFLKAQQAPGGNWSYEFNHDHTLGITALAGLALLENGVGRDDPAIRNADRVVRELAPRSDLTYDVALAILFLARVQPGSRGPNDDLIRELAERLAGGEVEGNWSYNIPAEAPPREPTGSVRAKAGSRREARRRAGWRDPRVPGDTSNTQFALLGMWAGGRHGFDANGPLEAIDGYFRKTQASGGGWGYIPREPHGEAMTCAGLMGLAIAAARPNQAERQTAKARGAALAKDPQFVAALASVARDARDLGPQSEVYYLWSLERVCVALGLRQLDGFDWYAAGARELLSRQMSNGSWPVSRWGALPDTCLALLFLRKANLAFELDRVLKLPGPGDGPKSDPAPAPAEDSSPKSGGASGDDVSVVVRQADEAKFPEIAVDFEVKNPDGSPKLDARRDDFKVTEDGQPVVIDAFQGPASAEARPTTVVLVLDHSRSMEEEDRIGGLKRAVAIFLERMPAGSRVAVIAFGSDVKVICPFTDDPRKVREAVDALVPEGATRYYDAVAEGLELLAREPGRRAVLAMTDGEDTFSRDATIGSDIRAARNAGLPVHTLGLGSEDEIESDALRRLASETRGQYFRADRADRLRSIYEELARRLGSSYNLSYKTARRLPDGTLRPIRISYRVSKKVGEAAVFIRGMVVPAAGWSRLFLGLLAALAALALLPARPRRGTA